MNREGFQRMYAEHFGALQRYCYFKLPSRADGDDVLGQVALAAWAKRDSLRNMDAFKPWLLQIATNQIRDFYRKRARHNDLPLSEVCEAALVSSRFGPTPEEAVHETLDSLSDTDRQILTLAYFYHVPQADIAQQLNVPLGTVKSRLHAARQRFKHEYPHPPKKGEIHMSKLPKLLPDYTIMPNEKEPFACKWEELMGWFLVPKLGEQLSWGMYDEGKLSGEYCMRVAGRAAVHGIEGVAVVAEIQDKDDGCIQREFIAQLTDTHVRYLAQSHENDGVKRYFTFMDGDDFLRNWGFGEDNCGNSIFPKKRGIIERCGSVITCPAEKFVLDVVDRCTVMLGGKRYDCIRVMDIECYNYGVASEQFLDKNGRTILWRRFDRNKKTPGDERWTINGETYEHHYDCITNYVC